MTGRYPFRYGLQTAVIPSASKYGLSTDEWLLPRALKEVGYQTAIIGKWHLGHGDRKYWPRQRGFDYQYGPVLGEIDYFTHSAHGKTDWYRDNQLVKEQGYATQLLGNDAVKLISSHGEKAKPCRQEPGESGRLAAEDRIVGAGRWPAAVDEGSERRGVARAYGVCRHTDSLPSCVFLSTSSDLPATA